MAAADKDRLRVFNVSGLIVPISEEYFVKSETLRMIAEREEGTEIYIPRCASSFKKFVLPYLLGYENIFDIIMDCGVPLSIIRGDIQWYGLEIELRTPRACRIIFDRTSLCGCMEKAPQCCVEYKREPGVMTVDMNSICAECVYARKYKKFMN
jgi:hypothetical protein